MYINYMRKSIMRGGACGLDGPLPLSMIWNTIVVCD